MKLTRREAIKLGVLGSTSLLVPLGYQSQALAEESCPESEPFSGTWTSFQEPLPIPTPLEPVCSEEVDYKGELIPTDFYEIEIKKCQQMIGGSPFEIWGYNGITPGPLIRQKGSWKDQEKRYSIVRFINKLGSVDGCPINAVVHLHGMASAPQFDGYATDYIPPDHYKDYIYPNDRAATIWYHDHALHKTQRNVKKGLLGMYIVEDEFEQGLNLPNDEFDVPLILQEHPDERNEVDILVNGALKPYMEVKRHKYRFRVLNAAPQSLFKLTAGEQNTEANNLNLKVIGADGGLRQNPVEVPDLELGVGERYEFVIDFNEVYESGVTQSYLKLEDIGFEGTQAVLLFKINPNDVQDNSRVPDSLRPAKRFENCPEESLAAFSDNQDGCATELIFAQSQTEVCPEELGEDNKWLINDKGWPTVVACAPAFDPDNPTCIYWTLRNDSEDIHPVHIHLSDLQIVERTKDGERMDLKPYEKNCWKDIFVIKEGETVKVAGVFGPHQGIYMMHCHNLKHEDCDMMVTFQVGDDNTDPRTIAPAKSISLMEPLCSPQTGILPSLPRRIDDYDPEAIEKYNLEVYGPD